MGLTKNIGVADYVDLQLDNLGTVGKLAVLIIDPTGITGWKDAKDAYNNYWSDPSLKNLAFLGLAGFGAVPVVGKLFKSAKTALKLSKDTEAAVKIAPEIVEKNLVKLGIKEGFISSGNLIKFSQTTAGYLERLAKITGDETHIKLALIAKHSAKTGQRYPEEIVKFVDTIGKEAKVVATDAEKVWVKKGYSDHIEKTVTWNGLLQRRVLFAKHKTNYKTNHTGEFRDELKFEKDVTNIELKLDKLSPNLKEAADAIDSFNNTGKFVYSENMMDEIYSKSKGTVLTYEHMQEDSKLLRNLFSDIERPKILRKQFTKKIEDFSTDVFDKISNDNIEWLLKYIKLYADHYGVGISRIGVVPIKTKGFVQKLALPLKSGKNEITFWNDSGKVAVNATKRTNPFIRGYLLTIDGKPIIEYPSFVLEDGTILTGFFRRSEVPLFDEHHKKSLALMQAEAYLKDPTAHGMRLVKNYQSIKPSDYYDNFMLLLKDLHTGEKGIHAASKLKLYDFKRIKSLARSGRFKSMDDLMYYYTKLKMQQAGYLGKYMKKGGSINTLQIIKNYLT